jgi:hypothetical protein
MGNAREPANGGRLAFGRSRGMTDVASSEGAADLGVDRLKYHYTSV